MTETGETTETGSTVPPYPVAPNPITRMDSRLRGNDGDGGNDGDTVGNDGDTVGNDGDRGE